MLSKFRICISGWAYDSWGGDFYETFVKGFSISPDGKWIVFERTKGFVDDEADLWVVGIDGKGLRLLTKNANHPAWGK